MVCQFFLGDSGLKPSRDTMFAAIIISG